MKYFSFLILCFVALIFQSCDGAEVDNELAHPNFCYFQPSVTSQSSFTTPPEIGFTFLDNLGEFTVYSYQVGETVPIMSLQKNRCYQGWAIGGVSDNTGSITYEVIKYDDVLFEYTLHIDETPDIFDVTKPDFSFCLDSNCNVAQ